MTRPISQLDDALRDFANGLGDAEKLLGKVALAALRRSMERAPVLTGNLRRSLTTRVESQQAYLGSAVEYAEFVHEGTSKMPGRPFFVEGVEEAIPEIIDIVDDWATDVFTREVAR